MGKKQWAKYKPDTRVRDFRCMECGAVIQTTKTKNMTVSGHIKTMYCYRCQDVKDCIQIGGSQSFRVWGFDFEEDEVDEVTRQTIRQLNREHGTREETLEEVGERLETPMDGTRMGALRILGLLNTWRLDIEVNGIVVAGARGLKDNGRGYMELWINPEPELKLRASAYLYQVGVDNPAVIWSRRPITKYKGGSPYEYKEKKPQKARTDQGSQLATVTHSGSAVRRSLEDGRKGSKDEDGGGAAGGGELSGD